MSRLFIIYATKLVTIGVISISAIGGLPAIAAACEGGGEEKAGGRITLTATFAGNTGTFTNPGKLSLEIKSEGPMPKPGKGAITSAGTCTKGTLLSGLGGTCTFTQENPTGATIEAEWL
jgi:hypothetical protein